jgi:Flp pilus assembly protein CpaB
MKKVYLIAVIVAVIAGFATYMFANELDKKTTIKDADTVSVIVPLQDISANTKITDDMFAEDAGYFATQTVIAEDKAPNAVTSIDELKNMITVDKLYAGEQINSSRIEDIDGSDIALSLKLPDDKVAYSFTAASVKSVDGYISEGDTVDVLVAKENSDGEYESEIDFEGLKILRVSTNTANTSASSNGTTITEYSTLTVEVTKEEAKELYDIESNYNYKLILNNRD